MTTTPVRKTRATRTMTEVDAGANFVFSDEGV